MLGPCAFIIAEARIGRPAEYHRTQPGGRGAPVGLLDHVVRPEQDRLGNGEAEGLPGLEGTTLTASRVPK